MNIKLSDITKITKEIKKLFFVLRNDKEAQIQTRTLVLGIIVCFALNYSVSTLFIGPLQKNLKKKTSQRNELKASTPEQLNAAMSVAIMKLEKEKRELEEKIATLKFKEKILLEHWGTISNEERFTKVILTLLPNAPINIEKELEQVTLVDSRSQDTFEMYPMSLKGDAAFPDLFNYLQYIESRPEIGAINNLTIERIPTKRYDRKAKVRFNVMVSRLGLRENI